jgi:hypothetical protein
MYNALQSRPQKTCARFFNSLARFIAFFSPTEASFDQHSVRSTLIATAICAIRVTQGPTFYDLRRREKLNKRLNT